MKELLKDIWLSQIKGKTELKEIIRRHGRDEVKEAEIEGFIRVVNEKVELTEKGRKRIKVVLAGGVFDILHPGHVFFLSKARELGDILIVIVARDSTVRNRKRIPIVASKQRVELVKALKPVDLALIGRSENIFNILEEIQPDIVALGPNQYHVEKEIEMEGERRGMKLKAVRIKEFKACELSSTRAILQRIIDRNFPLTRQKLEGK